MSGPPTNNFKVIKVIKHKNRMLLSDSTFILYNNVFFC
jgi:hypothetical protein